MSTSPFNLSLIAATVIAASSTYAATPINLAHQPLAMKQLRTASSEMGTKELRRTVDFKNTLHIRVQQTYQGVPVWGGEGVIHVPNAGNSISMPLAMINQPTTSNGTFYQNIKADLASTTSRTNAANQVKDAISYATKTLAKELGRSIQPENVKSEKLVYIDLKKKAHWAYHLSFTLPFKIKGIPQKRVMIIDATTHDIYESWNDIKTLDDVSGSGIGGNEKMGKLTYDGVAKDLPALSVERDASQSICSLQNKDVVVLNKSNDNMVVEYPCQTIDSAHGNTYWDSMKDFTNGAYSPSNDALYAGMVIKDMYQKWYHVDVLTNDDDKHTPMKLTMVVHEAGLENAYWDGAVMTFGDGGSMLYPLTSLGVGAHEISHGFTQQHSNLVYTGQSGGLNESFSDMAAQAAEYYSYGKSSWLIGAEIMKEDGATLRYMDQPSKDCGNWPAGWLCSIDRADQYGWGLLLDVHYSSGVYNHFFYLLSNSTGWNTKKAFDVMEQANASYWTATSDFQSAACGVITATKDYGYDLTAVQKAFEAVAIDTSSC